MGLKNLQPEIQRHFLQQQCQLEEAFPAVTRSFSGEAGTRNCLFQGRAELGNIPGTAASAWFRSEWIQRLPYHSCLPCLTARGYHACSRDVSNTRAAHNWSPNYLSIQFKHSKLWSAALRRPQTHPPSCLFSYSNQVLHPASEQRSRTRNLQQHWSQFCSKHVPEALTEAASTGTLISQDLLEGLWAGMEGGERQATSSRRAQHRARPPVGTATGHINLSPSICIQQSSGHEFVGSSSLIQAFVREVIAVKLSAFTSTKARVKM